MVFTFSELILHDMYHYLAWKEEYFKWVPHHIDSACHVDLQY